MGRIIYRLGWVAARRGRCLIVGRAALAAWEADTRLAGAPNTFHGTWINGADGKTTRGRERICRESFNADRPGVRPGSGALYLIYCR